MLNYELKNSQHKNVFFIHPQSDFKYGTHLHSSMECFLCLNGSVEANIGELTHTLSGGEAALIFPNQLHSYATKSPSDLLAIHFPSGMINSIMAVIKGKFTRDPVFSPSPFLTSYIDDCIALSGLSETTPSGSTSSAFYEDSPASLFRQKALMYLICNELFENCELEPVQEKKTDTDILPWVFTYIQDNFVSDISLRGIASSCGYDYCYLSKLLKRFTGMKFIAFLNGHRINRAKYLLANSAQNVSEIALQSGFNTLRSFNRAFLKETSQTPSEYRKLLSSPTG